MKTKGAGGGEGFVRSWWLWAQGQRGWRSRAAFAGAAAVSPLCAATRWQRWTASAASRCRARMMALGFLLFSFFPSFLLFLHYPLQPGAPNLNKLQVSSVSCSVNLWKGLFLTMVQRAKKSFWGVRTKFLCRRVQSEGDTAFLLGSGRFFLIPNHIYLSFLYLLTVQNVMWKKKKISYNVAAKLLPGECACWEPGAIWKQ